MGKARGTGGGGAGGIVLIPPCVGKAGKAKSQETSFFCEQKEAKKLCSCRLGRKSAAGGGGTALRSALRVVIDCVNEVFLLLFVHKKKIFCFSFSLVLVKAE